MDGFQVYVLPHLSKIKVKGSWNNMDLRYRNRRVSGVETMVCVLIHAPLFGAGINGPCGGKPSLRFDFGALFLLVTFLFGRAKRKVTILSV
jgi:hypothetical protein